LDKHIGGDIHPGEQQAAMWAAEKPVLDDFHRVAFYMIMRFPRAAKAQYLEGDAENPIEKHYM
jgi:hypothetical protein